MLGLEVTWSVRMLPQVAHAPKGAPPTNAGWDDAFLEERFGSMVDRLLQKRDINLAMVPDHLERELYLNVVRLLLNIATTALSSHDGAGGTQARARLPARSPPSSHRSPHTPQPQSCSRLRSLAASPSDLAGGHLRRLGAFQLRVMPCRARLQREPVRKSGASCVARVTYATHKTLLTR